MKLIKYGAFVLLTIVSAYLSINMFISLGADFAGKAILGVTATALEATKVFALLRIEYIIFLQGGLFVHPLRKGPWVSIMVYLILALVSIIASLGFTLVTVDKQVEASRSSFVAENDEYEYTISQKEKALLQKDAQIDALNANLSKIDANLATGAVKLSSNSSTLTAERNAMVQEISDLKKLQNQAKSLAASSLKENVYGMFALMAMAVGVKSEKTIMTLLLLMISIMLEIAMVYTSPTIKVSEDEVHEVAKVSPPKRTPAPKPPATAKQIRTANVPETRRISSAATPAVAEVKVSSPPVEVITEKKRKIPTESLLQKILTPVRGVELRKAAEIAYETGANVEDINRFLVQLSEKKGVTGLPVIYQKQGVWYLNYTKEIAFAMSKGLTI